MVVGSNPTRPTIKFNMKTNHYDRLRSLDYRQYKKAIERSEFICLSLERHLKDNYEKSKIFSKIESVIVNTFLEFTEKEKELKNANKSTNGNIVLPDRFFDD